MGIIDIARDTLKEIPLSDVLRERLSLAFDYSADLERKIETLQTQIGHLTAELEIERTNHQQTQQELERLRKEHEEEVRISHAVEFRLGKRTGNQWIAFCPRCHLPASLGYEKPCCSNGECKWTADIDSREIARVISQL